MECETEKYRREMKKDELGQREMRQKGEKMEKDKEIEDIL